MLQTTHGGVLGWVSQGAQFLGGGYMLIAAYAAFRDTKPAFIILEPPDEKAPYRYSVAVAIVLIAAVLRLVFLQALGTSVAFVTFYPAVMLAALYGGLRAGVLATFSVARCLRTIFGSSRSVHSTVTSPMDWLAIAIFVCNCLLVSWMVELLQKAQAQLQSAEADRRAELERTVEERTAELGLARHEAAGERGKTSILPRRQDGSGIANRARRGPGGNLDRPRSVLPGSAGEPACNRLDAHP